MASTEQEGSFLSSPRKLSTLRRTFRREPSHRAVDDPPEEAPPTWRTCWTRGGDSLKSKGEDVRKLLGTRLAVIRWTVKKRPDVLLVPLALFVLIVGLGVFGVMAGLKDYTNQRKASATVTAGSTLSSSIQILQQAYTPLIAMRERILNGPSWPAFLDDWSGITERTLVAIDIDPNATSSSSSGGGGGNGGGGGGAGGDLLALEAAPNGVLGAVYPEALLGPSVGLDLNGVFHAGLMDQVKQGGLAFEGPVRIYQGNWTMLASLPIYLPSNSTNGTSPDPSWQSPPSKGLCDVPQCLQNGQKWWGVVYSIVMLDTMKVSAQLESMRTQGWRCTLVRVIPEGAQSEGGSNVLFTINGDPEDDGVSVRQTLTGCQGRAPYEATVTLQLTISPASGWSNGAWWIGAIVGVVFAGLVASVLLFFSMVSRVQQEWLLHSIIPPKVVEHMRSGRVFAELHDCCIIFADVVGFTRITSKMAPIDVASFVNEITALFENEAYEYGLLKIDVIGDCFMAGAGVLEDEDLLSCAVRAAQTALGMVRCTDGLTTNDGTPVEVRIGIHAGPCVTAVVGIECPKLTVFSDVVNVASRMESNGAPGKVHISDVMAYRLQAAGLAVNGLQLIKRGEVELKNRGKMTTHWLEEAGCIRRHWETAGSSNDLTPEGAGSSSSLGYPAANRALRAGSSFGGVGGGRPLSRSGSARHASASGGGSDGGSREMVRLTLDIASSPGRGGEGDEEGGEGGTAAQQGNGAMLAAGGVAAAAAAAAMASGEHPKLPSYATPFGRHSQRSSPVSRGSRGGRLTGDVGGGSITAGTIDGTVLEEEGEGEDDPRGEEEGGRAHLEDVSDVEAVDGGGGGGARGSQRRRGRMDSDPVAEEAGDDGGGSFTRRRRSSSNGGLSSSITEGSASAVTMDRFLVGTGSAAGGASSTSACNAAKKKRTSATGRKGNSFWSQEQRQRAQKGGNFLRYSNTSNAGKSAVAAGGGLDSSTAGSSYTGIPPLPSGTASAMSSSSPFSNAAMGAGPSDRSSAGRQLQSSLSQDGVLGRLPDAGINSVSIAAASSLSSVWPARSAGGRPPASAAAAAAAAVARATAGDEAGAPLVEVAVGERDHVHGSDEAV